MKFDNDILKQIEQWGQDGYSISRIARELNMTYTELEDEWLNNEKLKNSIDRALKNYEQFKISEQERGDNAQVLKEMYLSFKQKHDKNSDNRIEIEYV